MELDGTGALPVRVVADARLQGELVPWLEGTLGWQVTRGDEVPAALALLGVGSDVGPDPDVPSVLLVRDEDRPARAAAAAARGPAHVLHWPDERASLPAIAAGLLDRGRDRPVPGTTVRLGGAAGGVGTTTVALALGGLLAWQGRSCLVVPSGDVPVPDVPVVAPDALAAHRTWDAAVGVAGVPGLRVLSTTGGVRARVAVPDGVVVLRDDGVTADVDVVVCVRDRAGRAAVDATAAALVVVGDRGAVDPASWARRLPPGTRQLVLPWSTRVARAGLAQRVPASLPGRWLALLAPLARSLSSTATGSTGRDRAPPP